MASSVRAIITLSCRLAPLRRKPSGVPRASVTRWRFVPGLPRPVGFGPVEEPLFGPGQTRCPGSPGSSRSHRPRASAPAGPDADASRDPPSASRAADASNSSRSRSPSQPAASPRATRSAGRTGYRSAPPGFRSDVGRPSDVVGAAADAGRSRARDHWQKRTCHTDQRPTKRSVPVLFGPLKP
jgi:hypothetical protein